MIICINEYIRLDAITSRTLRGFVADFCFNLVYRQPETEFVPQMFVPENGQSWQRVGCLLFQASARLRSCAHYFHYSIQKRCGKLGRYVSFNEIHGLYM